MRYTAILLALACLGAGKLALDQRREKTEAQTMSTSHPSGPHLFYPLGHLPTLELPDGQRREVRSVLSSIRPLRFGDYLWDDGGIPKGEAWIRIDLAHQTLSVFRAGHEIGSTVIIYGTDGKPTPSGVFRILERAKQHQSSLYDAAMPFMLRLTPDGVAIHASAVREGSATHGCIGIPIGFARLLFDQIKRGDAVAIFPANPSELKTRL